MTEPALGALSTTLKLNRTYPAAPDLVFSAWTDPARVKQWWGIAEGYSTPIVEIDLQVGGRYRLGMQPPDQNVIFVATGVYQEITRPEKLVYTWSWEPTLQADTQEPAPDAPAMMAPQETLVTVEFLDRSGATELVLTHENFPNQEARDHHQQGWTGVLDQLDRTLAGDGQPIGQ